MSSLVDHFRPNVHDAPITAAAYDAQSGVIVTADADGLVAVQRPQEATPQLVFRPGGAIDGAVAISRGGHLIAVGDRDGTVGVYESRNGEPSFQEKREGQRGRVRAMLGVSISPEGSTLASIARDGLLRVWALPQGERNAWKGYGGSTVCLDIRGQRVLAIDASGQPCMMDLMTQQALHMDRLQMPAQHARFTPDGTMVVAAGPSGISVLKVVDGRLIASFATRGGSGIANLLISGDGRRAAAVTQRSIHSFSLPDLQLIESSKHGAPEPSGAAIWTPKGFRVAGNDGILHTGGAGAAGQVTAASGFGKHRIAVHSRRVALWRENRRVLRIDAEHPLKEAHIDRDGRYIVTVPRNGTITVLDAETGALLLPTGTKSRDCLDVEIGGPILAVRMKSGGCRWWNIPSQAGLELKWAQGMTLSHGGTWLGVVTPKGAVKIIDPSTGSDAVPAPTPLADVPVRLLGFVNRRPDLLVLDEDGVLGRYELADAIRRDQPATGDDILTIHVPVDKIWGLTGGRHCVLRLPEGDRSTIMCIDLRAKEVIHEVTGLDPDVWVDVENGLIIEPAPGSALLERELDGRERRVLRALQDDQWICFDPKSILDHSEDAAGVI